jgi:formate hydrogenlyase subunit 3/multisubunit Na+/H+ antiporter MnhD subunit
MMMLLVTALLLPLVLAALTGLRMLPSGVLLRLLPVAAFPAWLLSLLGDSARTFNFPWLILESRFGLGHSGPAFLFFTASIWLIAGWFAAAYMDGKPGGRRFAFFWLVTLTGNVALVLAGDVPTFYTAFAWMTFAAYGLVVHEGSIQARRAGRVYIILAVLGEGMLVGGLLLALGANDSFLLADTAAAVADSPRRNLILLLLLLGLGVKAGILPLHFWLPLAHPIAPVPASAVLSGVMIKAGLLGWIQLLPGGMGDFHGWSLLLILLGLTTAFYAIVCGLSQRDPKTILAYSSVSQMGIMLTALGIGLAEAAAWRGVVLIVTVYALNHAFCKSALFLGMGLVPRIGRHEARLRNLLLSGLALPALGIAGAPLMGGAVAKYALKLAADGAPTHAAPVLLILLPLSATATTLLLGHFILRVRRQMLDQKRSTPHRGRLAYPWLLALAGSLFGVYFAIPFFAGDMPSSEMSWRGIAEGAWPILAGLLLLHAWFRLSHAAALEVPPGDLIAPIEALIRRQAKWTHWLLSEERFHINFVPVVERLARSREIDRFFGRAELLLRRRETAGFFMFLLVLMLYWLLL